MNPDGSIGFGLHVVMYAQFVGVNPDATKHA
jgi:hypothetical protein